MTRRLVAVLVVAKVNWRSKAVTTLEVALVVKENTSPLVFAVKVPTIAPRHVSVSASTPIRGAGPWGIEAQAVGGDGVGHDADGEGGAAEVEAAAVGHGRVGIHHGLEPMT